MLASHCPEVDTRCSNECEVLNFVRNAFRTLASANQQKKSLRCLPNVTRLHSYTTRMDQEGNTKATQRCGFKYDIGLNFYFICTIQIHQKGNTEFIGGMHYTNGIQKKVSRLIRICIPVRYLHDGDTTLSRRRTTATRRRVMNTMRSR